MSGLGTLVFTFDTSVSAPTVALTSDTGLSSSDKITKVGTLNVTGIEAGAAAEYSIDGGVTWSAAFVAASGANKVGVRQTDVAGNVSSVTTLSFTLDAELPAVPGVSLLNDTGVSATDLITRVGTLSLSGVETGAKVEYSGNGGTTWTTSYAPAQGRNTVTVRQTDVAGNVSGLGTLVFTFDTTATVVSSVSLPVAGTYALGSTLRITVKFSEAVRMGGAGTPAISITIGSTVKNAVYESGDGTDTMVFAYTVAADDRVGDGIAFAGSISLTAGSTLQDLAGNAVTLTLKLPSTLPKIVI